MPHTPTITLIAAVAKRNVIGQQGGLPFHLPADLQHFKALTLHKTVLMGRKTYDSIGKALPKRRNLVLTRQMRDFADAEICYDLKDVWEKTAQTPELCVIGGAEIYRLLLPFAHSLWLTKVDADIAGDTFFPEFDESIWQQECVAEHSIDDKHAYAFKIYHYQR